MIKTKESYTVKEIADILGVSKTAIQKYIKASAIDYDYIEKNRQYYFEDKADKIIQGFKNRNITDNDNNVSREIDNRQPKTENRKLQTDAECNAEPKEKKQDRQPKTENRKPQTDNRKPENQVMIETLQGVIEILEKQLEENRKQLEIKDKQIQNLTNSLDKALALTEGQIFIQAVDKKEMLIENNKESNEEINITETINNKEQGLIKKLLKMFK